MKSFKTKLKLTNKQRSYLSKCVGTYRHAYNTGLAYTKEILNWNSEQNSKETKIKFPSSYDLNKWYVRDVKSEFEWIKEVPKDCGQYALVALAEAWKRCFKKQNKPPRFKSRKKSKRSFSFQTLTKIGDKKLRMPVGRGQDKKLGILKTYETLPKVDPKKTSVATISQDACGDWWISYLLPIEFSYNPPSNREEAVGVDLGVKDFAVLSTGEKLNVPEKVWQLKTKIAKLQRIQSRLMIRSRRYNKIKLSIARKYRQSTRIINNFLHHLSKRLVTEFSSIGLEDLNVSGMKKLKTIAPKLQKLPFYRFRTFVEYKAKDWNCNIFVVDRWFPSSKTCSSCGVKKDSLLLSERIFNCSCELSIDRDLNAALNLRQQALMNCL